MIEYFRVNSWEILLAFLLDFLIGDPYFIPHPIVGIGKLIEKTESVLRKIFSNEKFAGILLFLIVCSISFLSSIIVVYFSNFLKTSSYLALKILGYGIFIFLMSQFLALRGLINVARYIDKLLKKGQINKARIEIKALVGRDTEKLSEKKLKVAVVESLAENLNDAVIAPLFYLSLGGFPLLVLYKTVNTLDSMVGYRNKKYIKFGWFSAKMDDLFNYIPARISGILIVISCFFYKGFPISKRALKILLRDGRKHLSPNSGIPESAMAGALGIKMGGPNFYQGVLIKKPYIGEELNPKYSLIINDACNIVILSSLLFLILIITIYVFLSFDF